MINAKEQTRMNALRELEQAKIDLEAAKERMRIARERWMKAEREALYERIHGEVQP